MSGPLEDADYVASDARVEADKLEGICEYLHTKGYSVNTFLIALWSCEEKKTKERANRLLARAEGRVYNTAKIMDLWIERTPEATRPYLNRFLTEKVAGIVVKESTAALKSDKLYLPAKDIKIAHLVGDTFALRNLYKIYQTLLPCLCFLLFALLTAMNPYELKFQMEKRDKEIKAVRVCCFLEPYTINV